MCKIDKAKGPRIIICVCAYMCAHSCMSVYMYMHMCMHVEAGGGWC